MTIVQHLTSYLHEFDFVSLASNSLEPLDILITEETYRKIQNTVRAVKMPPVTVKGKSDQLNVYAILGNADDTDTPGDLAELRKLLKTRPLSPVTKGVTLDESKYKVLE